jgi:hypothetical protein
VPRSSARCNRSARNGGNMRLLAILLACSCRVAQDGSAPPAVSEASEPSSSGAEVQQQASAPPEAPLTPIPEPSVQTPAATPASLAESAEAKPAATPAETSEPQADEGDALLLENLTDALRETPFSAVVQYLRADVAPLEDDEVKVTYQVRVLEHIRGPKLAKLSYFAVVEKDEDISFEKKPVILTLCKGKEGYYWPGTGAEFPRTKNTRALVAKVRRELSGDQKAFKQCRPAD